MGTRWLPSYFHILSEKKAKECQLNDTPFIPKWMHSTMRGYSWWFLLISLSAQVKCIWRSSNKINDSKQYKFHWKWTERIPRPAWFFSVWFLFVSTIYPALTHAKQYCLRFLIVIVKRNGRFCCKRETKIALNSGYTTKSTHKISIRILNPARCFTAFQHTKYVTARKCSKKQ